MSEQPVNNGAPPQSDAAPTAEDAAAPTETTGDEVNSLKEQLTAAQTQAQEYKDGWQRERSDFQNYKRRIEKELRDSTQNASLDVLKSLIPVIDDFERAMSSIPSELENNAWLSGVTLVQRKFLKLLEDNGVSTIDPVGQPFDPARHEALGTDEDTETASGHVTVTLQKGYAAGDRVLRPALVRVAK